MAAGTGEYPSLQILGGRSDGSATLDFPLRPLPGYHVPPQGASPQSWRLLLFFIRLWESWVTPRDFLIPLHSGVWEKQSPGTPTRSRRFLRETSSLGVPRQIWGDAELKSLRRAAGLTVSDASSDNRARWAPGLFTVTVYI